MKKNKIFIDNFYEQSATLGLSVADQKKLHNVVIGFHERRNNTVVRKQVISEIFKALLLHDIIAFSTTELLDVIWSFGINDTILLLNTNRFELVDDQGSKLVLDENSPNAYSLGAIQMAHKSGDIKNSIDFIESRLNKSKIKNAKLINTLLLNVEKYNKLIDLEKALSDIKKETQYDISNGHISRSLNLSSDSITDIKRHDIYNILRIGKLNKTLIYSSLLGIDNIAMDGAVKPILGVKLSPAFNSSQSLNLFDELFESVFQKKGIPDLAELYIKKIITIDDYLKLLSTLGGQKFRQWVMDKEYSQSDLEADIISSNPTITNKYTRFIRWTVPNAIGLIFPAAGISSSFADSFVIDKLMKGWHPNFFLDNQLKKRIDQKVAFHERTERIASIKRKFPNIGQNDPCPCSSKKKFKKCCGK